MKKLLIDADYIAYKSCAAAETEIDWGNDVIVVSSRFSNARDKVNKELMKIQKQFDPFGAQTEMILFFSDSENFRKKILPAYKGHRNRKKPCGYKRVINDLKNDYQVIIMPTLEADDAMGIHATMHPGCVICSPDKDMKQIPGDLYNMEELFTVSKEEGLFWHYIQTLAGDQTDGYSGVPGIGIKKATTLFWEKGYKWDTIKSAFINAGLTEEDALVNARLAKILQVDDYDFTTEQPILFSPDTAARNEANSGAGPKTKDDVGRSE